MSIARGTAALLLGFVAASKLQAQDATITNIEPVLEVGTQEISFGAYFDFYFAHDFNDPHDGRRPYTVQAVRDDDLNVNLMYIEANVDGPSSRARIALHDGTAVEELYRAEEEDRWRAVQEARLGYRLSEGVWLDGGIYNSHLGDESFISRRNWLYTNSYVTDFSPHYQTGARLTYTAIDALSLEFHIINGWQNISNEDAGLAGGFRTDYRPTDSWKFAYANFFGHENGTRHFHDFLIGYRVSEKLSFSGVFDFGRQENLADGGYQNWYGWSLQSRYTYVNKSAISARVQQFSDPHGVITDSLTGDEFQAFSISVGHDFEPTGGVLLRGEIRGDVSSDPLFPSESSFKDTDLSFIVSLSLNL